MCHLIPLPHPPNAMELAGCMFQLVFRLSGIPEDIVSERGLQFVSQVWRAYCDRLGVALSLSSGYHPQTNGHTERLNQEIGKYLRQQCSASPHDWSRYMACAKYAQTSRMHSSLFLTSLQCVLGYQPPLFLCEEEPGTVPVVDDWFRCSERVWEGGGYFKVLLFFS